MGRRETRDFKDSRDFLDSRGQSVFQGSPGPRDLLEHRVRRAQREGQDLSAQQDLKVEVDLQEYRDPLECKASMGRTGSQVPGEKLVPTDHRESEADMALKESQDSPGYLE